MVHLLSTLQKTIHCRLKSRFPRVNAQERNETLGYTRTIIKSQERSGHPEVQGGKFGQTEAYINANKVYELFNVKAWYSQKAEIIFREDLYNLTNEKIPMHAQGEKCFKEISDL